MNTLNIGWLDIEMDFALLKNALGLHRENVAVRERARRFQNELQAKEE